MRREYVVEVVIAPVPLETPFAQGLTVIGIQRVELGDLEIRAEGDVHVVRFATHADSDFEAKLAAVEKVKRFLQVLLLSGIFYQVLNSQIVEARRRPAAGTPAAPAATTVGEDPATVFRVTPSLRDVQAVGNLALQVGALQRRGAWPAGLTRALELNYYAHLSPDPETRYVLLAIALDTLAPSGPMGNVLNDHLSEVQRKTLRGVLAGLLSLIGLREDLARRVIDHAFETHASRRPDQILTYLQKLETAMFDVNMVWRIRGSLAHSPLPEELRPGFDATFPHLRTAVLTGLRVELARIS